MFFEIKIELGLSVPHTKQAPTSMAKTKRNLSMRIKAGTFYIHSLE